MTRHYEGGNPPDIYLERYQAEHTTPRGAQWAVVLIVGAIVLCLLAAKIVGASEDGTLWLSDGTITTTETTLYNKPGEAHSLMILDLPPAPPYYLELESLAGVSTFGVSMVGGDVGPTVDVTDFDLPVFGYFPLLPYGPYILDVTELVQCLPPQQRTVGFRLIGWGEVRSMDDECPGGVVPQIVPENATLVNLGLLVAFYAGIRRRR